MKYKLTIGWLYPDLMNIYGDRGNIIVLKKRAEWRGIDVEILELGIDSKKEDLKKCDLFMMGGAQDTQQEIVAKDLKKKKKVLSEMIENYTPGLYICGGFQYLGKYYKTADGEKIEQLGILDIYTENPGNRRLIGNIAIKVDPYVIPSVAEGSLLDKFNKSDERDSSTQQSFAQNDKLIFVGFENHGGRTILGKMIKPLGKVLVGFGSNDQALEEGAVYKNTIGTYFHGPILPKNPILADWLIKKALEKKYGKRFVIPSEIEGSQFRNLNKSDERDSSTQQSLAQNDIVFLKKLDDTLSQKAKDIILKKLKI